MAKQLFPLVVYYYHHAPPRPDKDCTIPAIPLHSFSFIMIEWLLDQSNATSAFCQQNIMSLTLELMSDSYLLENEVVDGLILNLFALGQGIKRREPQQRRLVYTTYDDTLLDHGDMHLSKMACLHLVSALCPYLGADLCSKHCVPVLESFWNDSIFYVRKEVALTISSLAPHLDEDVLTQRLIPIFEQLCKDATWHVRHNSLIALPTLCDLVSHDLKVRLVGPCVQRFMNDLSQQVRFKLAELIGALIVKFLPKDWESSRAPGNVPAPLVEFFLSLGNQSRHEPGQHRLEDDMVLLCAFNFPAALLTVGASAWDTEFKDVYMKLAKDHQVKVRTSLAHSLHEISRILGPEKTERDLVHIFALYLMDVDQVKACVLDHLAAFLQGLPDHSRQEYLPVLSEIWEGLDDNYRLREVFTEQLDACLVFCSLDQIIDQILPLTAQATKDSIAIIRNNAAILIHHIVQIFHDHVDQFDKSMAILIDHIHTLTTSSQYHHRLLYVTICQHLISAEDLTLETWAKWLTPGLFPLVKDPVVNAIATVTLTLQSSSCKQIQSMT
ncbi:ARM repeat-containing protein [Hesseltinella vesiculosa]|uniref:ARM repeat-containing protein n=1 Tax=Hesseltinella vesiculosa TaxID=101127 RepID=A0A1X2GPJ1_9FUNG|nr:ARM repeat-containing protein [Hesseltinella vesiculosa]